MNDNHQRIDGSSPLSGHQGWINADFDSASAVNSSSQAGSDDAENSSHIATENSTSSQLEHKDIHISNDQHTAKSDSFPADRTNHNEHVEVNSQENTHSKDDHHLRNGFNTMDSAGIVQSVGHILRRARMARGLSIDDVSRQLRLSIQQVEAIEKEDFEKLPGRTFLRGFVRNYANLCQLNPAPLLQMLPESVPTRFHYERTPLKNKNLSFSGKRESSSNSRVILLILLFAAVLGAYFIFENDDPKGARQDQAEVKNGAEKASVEIPLALSPAPTEASTHKSFETALQLPAQNNLNSASNLTVQPLTLPTENKPLIQEAEQPIPTLSDIGTLHFRFSADSWVKIVDGKNITILEQLRKGGSEQTITGKRPLSIVLGNAAGVRLTYNDKDIDLSPYKKQDGTARLTLE